MRKKFRSLLLGESRLRVFFGYTYCGLRTIVAPALRCLNNKVQLSVRLWVGFARFAALVCLISVINSSLAYSGTTGAWTPTAGGGSATVAGVGVTVTGVTSSVTPSSGVLNAVNYWTNPYGGSVAGGPSLTIQPNPFGTTQTIVFTFSQPVDNPVVHWDRIGGASGTNASSSVWNLTGFVAAGGSVTPALLPGSNVIFSVSGNQFQRDVVPALTGGGECLSDNTGTACGSIEYQGRGVTKLTFTVTWAGADNTTTGDGIEFAISIADPSLTLKKTVTNDNGGALVATSVSLKAVGPVTINGLSGSAAVTYAIVSPGTYALSEVNPTGYLASNWSCTSGSLTGSNLTLVAGQYAECTINDNDIQPTLTVQKISNGGVGTFNFSGNNGFGSDSITTVTPGAAVNGALKTLTNAGTATTITETIPAGFKAASGTCTGTAAGNVTFNSAASATTATISLNATGTAVGNVLLCTFTNSKLPTLTVTKISNGGVRGFTFNPDPTLGNGWTAQTVTTTTSGTGVTGATQTLTAASTATTIIEAIPTGYALASATCTGMGTGGNATLTGSATTGSLALNAAATALGSNITCTFTNNILIDAVDDSFAGTPINGSSGGTTASVFTNDTLAGSAVLAANVTTTLVANGGLTGVVVNSNGTITVPAGTTSASYAVQYKICSVSAPTLCDIATATVAVAVSAPSGGTSCTGTNLAINGGIETPVISVAGNSMTSPSGVPGWTTNDTAIEQWSSGFLGVPSHTGSQFVEMNANIGTSILTQTPSAIHNRAELNVYWAHRGREGNDTALLVVTDNGGISTSSGNFTTDNTAWVVRSLTHVAAATASATTLKFDSISSTGGASLGNFVDSVEVCQTYLTLTKTLVSKNDINGDTKDSVGDTITYSYSISNPAGNARYMTSISITDDKIGTIAVPTPISGDTNTNGFLDAGETWIKQASYTLTQSDINAAGVTNIAFVSGSTGTNTIRSDTGTVTVPLVKQPSLLITKTSNAVAPVGSGAAITYFYDVLNNGNTTIFNIQVSDIHNGNNTPPVPGSEALKTPNSGTSSDVTPANNIWSSLAPGDTVRFSAAYTVNQQDVDLLQ